MIFLRRALDFAKRMLNPAGARTVELKRLSEATSTRSERAGAAAETRGAAAAEPAATTAQHRGASLRQGGGPYGPSQKEDAGTYGAAPVSSLKPASLRDPSSPWRTLWLRRLSQQAAGRLKGEHPARLQVGAATAEQETRVLVDCAFDALSSIANDFNALAEDSPVRLTVTTPYVYKEAMAAEVPGQVPEGNPSGAYYRCRFSSSTWSLSVRGAAGMVEFFLVPVSEVMLHSQAEAESRLKARLRLSADGRYWMLEGLPADEADLRVLMRELLKDLVLRSAAEQHSDAETPAQLLNLEGERLAQAIHLLVVEKQNLVQKIVMQQEEIQNQIARDLHDAVISDVMLLKRSLSENRRLPDAEVVKILDKITGQLREICHDLAPRDLKDWGLQTVIEDMLQRVAERMGADCALNCDSELPDLPNPVQLHIFRIVQECLNNIEKYSGASRVLITLEASRDALRLSIEDNGKGFSLTETGTRKTREGGRGMGSIRERAELIRAFFPARLTVASEPDVGSRTTLEIALAGSFAPS